jgi:aminoglycoside phosphotransferase family enzyme/adenylate kinase family enzyme
MEPSHQSVGALETHISQVFFTPDRVLKLLKPVDNSFLSFADRQTRIDAATAEFQLNHRISPDVYLGLSDLVENHQLTDRLIVMRRLPAERQLDRLVDQPEFPDLVRETARRVATFHCSQPPLTGDRAQPASLERLESLWSDNLADLAPLAGTVIPDDAYTEVGELADRYLRARRPLFDERIAQGWIRDGHGDLRAEHVFCLPDGPRLIDCLAFRDDFRIADVLNDVAFLAMDLHRLAGPGAAQRFIAAYDEFTGEHHPGTLAHHYVAYRAHVRAKVAAIRLGQGDLDAKAEVAAYHGLAHEHLRVGQVRLVLVGGGTGTGKSSVAEGLADRLGAIWLRTDEARRSMATGNYVEADPERSDPPSDGLDQGLYAPGRSDAVYCELVREAEHVLSRGVSVVLDATWRTDQRRQWARDLASRTDATLSELQCQVPLAVAQRRITQRRATGQDPSEATPELAAQLAGQFEPWPKAAVIDNTGSVVDSVADAVDAVTKPSTDTVLTVR